MADLGTISSGDEDLASTVTGFMIGPPFSFGALAVGDGFGAAASVPTTGQIWPRGNW